MRENVQDAGHQIKVEYESREGDVEKTKADLVIGADGPSSSLRKIFLPDVQRKYVGYVAWRGTVPESEATAVAQKAFVGTFTFLHAPGTQILSYVIPGENGSFEPGK